MERLESPYRLSVIIPTHNRRELLMGPLRALEAQTMSAEQFEVIVVADGCVDGTEEMLRATKFSFELIVLSQGGSGAATARNRGAHHARADLLVFVDDDVVLGPGALDAHLRHHKQHRGTVGIGPYLLDPPVRPSLLIETRRRWWGKQFERIADPTKPPSYEDLLPGNMSIARTCFERVGRFCQDFRRWGSEDYELGVRLIEQGYRIMLVPDARARHLQTLSLESDFRNIHSNGAADIIFAKLHPGIAPTLWVADRWHVDAIAERSPRFGDLAALVCLKLLAVLDRTGPKRVWEALHRHVRRYAYWRGVADQRRLANEREISVRK